jgi:N-carbamoyl-D-amino-acid hydrolase
MSRSIVVAAAQMGPVSRGASRSEVLLRMKELLRGAAAQGAKLVVYPELALTSFFPRWDLGDSPAADAFYEAAVPGASTQGLFEEARRLGIGVCLGYAERETIGMRVRRFNSAVLTAADGSVVGRYRKIHLPGDREPQPGFNFQHLEKRCFEPGDLGFGAWRAFGGTCGMLLCNDRRWPEAWRVLGLQGVELVLVGYNTPLHNPEAPQHDAFVKAQHRLVMQSGAYQNATWAVAVAKGGVEEGQAMLADTIIVAPSGQIVAESSTQEDELVVAAIDLDATRSYKSTIFDFAAHREPGSYRLITQRKGAVPPS